MFLEQDRLIVGTKGRSSTDAVEFAGHRFTFSIFIDRKCTKVRSEVGNGQHILDMSKHDLVLQTENLELTSTM